MLFPLLDSKERRIRALWRIVLTLLLYVITNTGFSLMAGVAVMAFLPEEIDAVRLSGDQVAYEQALQEFFLNTPVTGIINIVATLAGVLATIWLATRFLDRRPFANVGMQSDGRWWQDLLAGLGIGAAGVTASVVLLLISGSASLAATLTTSRPQVNLAMGMLEYTLLFIGVGIYEELIFRGYILKNLAEGLRLNIGNRTALLAAMVVSSALFGLVHLGNPNATPFSVISIFLAGIMLSLPYLWTGQIGLSIGLHITWNLFQGVIFGLPVSGTSVPESLLAFTDKGPEWLTGGAFGPEGGLVGLVGMAVIFGLVFLYVRKTRGEASLHTEINDYQIPVEAEEPLKKERKYG